MKENVKKEKKLFKHKKSLFVTIIIAILIFVIIALYIILYKGIFKQQSSEITTSVNADSVENQHTSDTDADSIEISEAPTNDPNKAYEGNPIEKNNITEPPAETTNNKNYEHLEFYDEFDKYNSSYDYFKGFVLSELWIDGEAYYQLLNEEKEIKIIVDSTQENAVIYHDGKSMDYNMGYMFREAHTSAEIELSDVTGDDDEELIIYHHYVGFGTWFTYCDIINLFTMTKYKVENYFDALYSKITVEPIRFIENDSVVCRVIDVNGNVSYGIAMGNGSSDLNDYSFEVSDFTSNSEYTNNEKKCINVNINICLDDFGCSNLGSISSTLILNTETNCFELNDDFVLKIDEVYYFDTVDTSETNVNEITTPEKEAFISVLTNEKTFVYDGEYVLLEKLLEAGEDDSTFEITHFTVIDIDGDGSTEVVLEIGFYDNVVYYEVLRYDNGEIEGYNFGDRQLYDLKSDGTFGFSGGAGYYGWAKLKFSKGSYEYVTLGLLDYDNIVSPYMIGQEQVSEKIFDEMSNEQDQKEAVIWYEFTDINLKNAL